jgi:hypothetical protein
MNSCLKKLNPILLAFLFLLLGSCEKFLDEKQSVSLTEPTTVKDLQALLDTYYLLNEVDPSADEVSAGEFYVTDADFTSRTETDQRLYTWQNDNVLAPQVNDWYYGYSIIYRANTVLENIKPSNLNIESWRNLRGQALFYRAKAYLQAVNIWAKVYDPITAANDIGVPIRADVNFNEKSVRASVKQNYELIIADLKEAITLLPDKQVHVLRPSKPAAAGLLARAYLWMGNYAESLKYAELCLLSKNELIDFNTLTATATYPMLQFNAEVLAPSRMSTLPILALSRAKIIPELYASYDTKDLRKTVYLKDNANGSYGFKGSYDGSSIYFSGVATDEVYLTKAECNARLGKLSDALTDLNTLLRKRYKTGMYVDYSLTDQNEVLQLILRERRKELVFRGLRWADLKRLNREGANISLSRTVAGKTYTLPANSARFAIPLPDDVIVLSGMPQNTY